MQMLGSIPYVQIHVVRFRCVPMIVVDCLPLTFTVTLKVRLQTRLNLTGKNSGSILD